MSKFMEVMGFEPTDARPTPPDSTRVAATGAAMPAGAHTLTDAQQRAWFGGVVFRGPVRWDGAAFVTAEGRLTPDQVVERARA